MLRKIIIIFTILLASSIIARTLKTFDAQTVEAKKIEGIAEISTKPSIVALATIMKNFRASLSSKVLDTASYPLGHKESYRWTNFPPAMQG